MFDKLNIHCPYCKRDFKINRRKLKPGSSIRCPLCKKKIKISGDDVNKPIDDLEKELKSFSSKLKIKIF